jgi:2-keto-4-pentenoate hydratase/2-oxohepta-3-ene-1,7-dioic acid hydratase in catechol pathway
MRIIAYRENGEPRLGVKRSDGALIALSSALPGAPVELEKLLQARTPSFEQIHAAVDAADDGSIVELSAVELLPPLTRPGKIICVGLNYVDHAKESPYKDLPKYPVLFTRFANSLIAHDEPIVRPINSEALDWEGEIAVIIGKTVRHATVENALDAVAGYALFNDGSLRDYQFKTHQWLMGKSFDDTGAFGPEFVTADELPKGAKGLRLETRVNGETVQSASTDDMIFSVAEIIAFITEGLTLDPGDVIITGTPAGVGFARTPPRFMKHGDICEVEVQGLGILRNPVVDEVAA